MTEGKPLATPNQKRLVELGMVLTVILVAWSLRLARLPFLTMWSDEYHSVRISSLPLAAILSGNNTGDLNPPLYSALLRLQRLTFGDTEIAMRSLSLAFAMLSMPLFFKLAQGILREFIPSIAALVLMAFHPMFIYYSLEIRPYSLLILFGLLSFLSCVKVQGESKRSQAWAILLALSLAGCMYAHHFGIIAPIAISVFMATNIVLSKKWSKSERLSLFSIAIAGILYLPGLLMFRTQALSYPVGGYLTPLTTSLQVFVFSLDHPPYEQLLAATAITAFVLGMMVLITQIRNIPAVLLMISGIATGIVSAVLATLVGVNIMSRYLIVVLPFALTAMAATLTAKNRAWHRLIKGIGVITIALYIVYGISFVLNTQRENQQVDWKADWKQLSAVIGNLRITGEPIVIVGWGGSPLEYYLAETTLSSVEMEQQLLLHLHPSYLIVMTPYAKTMPIMGSVTLLYEDDSEGLRVLRLRTPSER